MDKKKKIIFLGIFICVLLIGGLGVAFAYFQIVSTGSSVTTIIGKTDCLDIAFSSNDNEVKLTYNYPISDEFALSNIEPIEITITNKCNMVQKNINYTLTLTTLANSNNISDYQIRTKILKNKEEVIKDNTYLNEFNMIRSGGTYTLLNNTFTTNNITKGFQNKRTYVIDVGNIASNSTNTYQVYLWVDYYEGDKFAYLGVEHNSNYDNSTENKTFNGILSLITNIEDSGEAISSTDYDYSGTYATFNAPEEGDYFIQLWGASGASSNAEGYAGKGAYTEGILHLTKNEIIYVYVGSEGSSFRTTSSIQDYVYNGGASSGLNCLNFSGGTTNSHGGGATDIRLTPGEWDNFEGLKSRIMVAAGGGGGYKSNAHYAIGGSAGTLSGYSGMKDTATEVIQDFSGKGGEQTFGGSVNGSFGKGGHGTLDTVYCNFNDSTGGGGGYYGGGGSNSVGGYSAASAGGGSSFISGYEGCNAITATSTESNIVHTGDSIHYSNKVFLYPGMIAGNSLMPSYDGTSTMTGNTGHGHAKITFLR